MKKLLLFLGLFGLTIQPPVHGMELTGPNADNVEMKAAESDVGNWRNATHPLEQEDDALTSDEEEGESSDDDSQYYREKASFCSKVKGCMMSVGIVAAGLCAFCGIGTVVIGLPLGFGISLSAGKPGYKTIVKCSPVLKGCRLTCGSGPSNATVADLKKCLQDCDGLYQRCLEAEDA